ncbi:MAG TPA: hypothetical protein VHO03_03360 [Ignavibacteriales bacterium]|nr:hypothetical protein [Ignavibacteriales bacterium]
MDDKTWSDLNLNDVYSLIDRNISGPGRQYLYHLLHKYELNDDKLDSRFNQIKLFKENQGIREKIQLALQRLSSDDTYFIISLLLGEKPIIPKYPRLIYLSSALSILSILAAFYNSTFFFAVLFMAVLNLIITKIYSSGIYESFIGFSNLNKMIVSANELAGLESETAIEQLSVLKKHSGVLKKLNKKVSHLVIDKSQLDTFAQTVIEYLNMFCLFDLVAYTRSVIELYKYKKELKEVFDAVASLDAHISIASYFCSIPYYSKPEFISGNTISFDEVYHPLIDEAVPNSISGLSRSALITGSNMAGKTTFIKCIGVNTILSQTLGFTLSRRTVIPKLIVKSSIKIEDSIADSRSYYFSEVEEIKKLIGLSRTEKKYLFIIDEIFRGTNTVERLGISAAVLKQLNHNNLVLVTTHDIELQDLLDNSFSMYHFSEQVEGDRYYFDFRIKEGPCSSGNAIKLLELTGYPEQVTNEAKQISNRIISKEGVNI